MEEVVAPSTAKRLMAAGAVVYSVLGSLFFIMVFQFGLVSRDTSILNDRREELEDEIAKAERRLGDLGREKWARERDAYRLTRRVKDLENKLRGTRWKQASNATLPKLYIITPTNTRPTQKADLTRLSYTFMQVPNIMWIVVEDSDKEPSNLVKGVLVRSGLEFVHMTAGTPAEFKRAEEQPRWLKPRGVEQRNTGLRWLRKNLSPQAAKGVVYFADDDNTYDIRIFQEMRAVKKCGVWPVGLVGELMAEGPKVEDGQVVGWTTGWRPDRPFPIDMAGFAVGLPLILHNIHTEFTWDVQRGYQESHLLTGLGLKLQDLQPLATEYNEVLVWHTQTVKPKFRNEVKLNKQGIHSNGGKEV